MKHISFILALLFSLSWSANAQSLQEILSSGESDSKKESSNRSSRSTSSDSLIISNLQTHSLGLGIGQTFLKSDFGKSGEDQITWDLYYNYRASHSFDFIANFHLQKHKFSNTYTRTAGLALGIKARVFNFDNFAPFVMGGFGFYQPQRLIERDGESIKSESKTTFGWHMGGGAELQLNRHFSAGVKLHIHNPFSIQQEEGPDVEGWYYKLMLTGMYTF